MRHRFLVALVVTAIACSWPPRPPQSLAATAPTTPLELALSRQLSQWPGDTVFVERVSTVDASLILKTLSGDTSAYGRLANSLTSHRDAALTLPSDIDGRPIAPVTDSNWVYRGTRGVPRTLHRVAPPVISSSGDTAIVLAEAICGALCGAGSIEAYLRVTNRWQYARTLASWQY